MEGHPTGIGRYLEGLLSGLAELPESGRFTLFFKGEPFEHPLWTEHPERFTPFFDHRPKAHPILWEQFRLPRLLRRGDFDLLFSPCNALPPGTDLPSLVTLHDLSFEHLGEEFGWKERWRRRLLGRRAARRATRVLTDTGAGARDLEHTYNVPPERLGVVPLAVDQRFAVSGNPNQDAQRLTRLGLEAPYLLFCGTLLPRRRPHLLVEAFAAIAPEHPDLLLVLNGRNALPDPSTLDAAIEASGVPDRILRLGYIEEDDLVPLYRNAHMALYISALEGFGLPPLEALAAGTPALVSPGQALDDLWPNYPFRTADLSPESVHTTLAQALADPQRLAAVGREGQERMVQVTWKTAAQEMVRQMHLALGKETP